MHTRRDLILEASSKARHRDHQTSAKRVDAVGHVSFRSWRTGQFPPSSAILNATGYVRKARINIRMCVCVCVCACVYVCTILHYRRDEGLVCQKIEEGRARSSSRERDNLKSRKLDYSKIGRLGSSCFSFHISWFDRLRERDLCLLQRRISWPAPRLLTSNPVCHSLSSILYAFSHSFSLKRIHNALRNPA